MHYNRYFGKDINFEAIYVEDIYELKICKSDETGEGVKNGWKIFADIDISTNNGTTIYTGSFETINELEEWMRSQGWTRTAN